MQCKLQSPLNVNSNREVCETVDTFAIIPSYTITDRMLGSEVLVEGDRGRRRRSQQRFDLHLAVHRLAVSGFHNAPILRIIQSTVDGNGEGDGQYLIKEHIEGHS